MGEFQYKLCSFCKGVNHDEAYKLKASNFYSVRVDIFGGNSPVPMPMQPNQTDTVNKHYNAIICKDCLALDGNSPIADIIAIMEVAKKNDADASAALNS
jgi:hypothetical protein